MESNRNIGRGIIGIVLILIGVAFIGRTLDFFPRQIMHYVFSWEMILIVLGVIFISTRENKTTGWILLIIGLMFLIPDVVHIPYSIRRLFWPSVLIIIGLLIIFRISSHKGVIQGIIDTDIPRNIPVNICIRERVDLLKLFLSSHI